MHVPYNYLDRQFSDADDDPGGFQTGARYPNSLSSTILHEIKLLALSGDFTLGRQVEEFEGMWAEAVGAKHAVGVSNGTDAIFLALKAAGIGAGDVVATAPNSFLASVGAILQAGATPAFVDVDQRTGLMDDTGDVRFPKGHTGPDVSAVVPVHWTGDVSTYFRADTPIIYDAAQAVGATGAGGKIGGDGFASAYSLHPLKNVNVWGDGGMVTTDSEDAAIKMRSLRNHGLLGRDTWLEPGYNHRLSTLQAIVGKHVISGLDNTSKLRRNNAARYIDFWDDLGVPLDQFTVPERRGWAGQESSGPAFHLFQIQAQYGRDELVARLNEQGIEAKVHYPRPLHLQPALREYGWRPGDLPEVEAWCAKTVSLPVHEYLTGDQIEFAAQAVIDFYRG